MCKYTKANNFQNHQYDISYNVVSKIAYKDIMWVVAYLRNITVTYSKVLCWVYNTTYGK